MKTGIKLLIILLITSSCLRYTPSRDEIEKEHNKTSETPSAEFVGEEAFYALEQDQDERLKNLIASRKVDAESFEQTYRIGMGDLLQLNVFDVEELNRKVRVRPSGDIALPLIGTVNAVGLTEAELQAEITRRLDEYVYSPQVQLFIEEYAAHKVSVIGEVKNPGAYALTRNNYSLIELLSEAGGRTEKASSIIILIPSSEKTPAPAPDQDAARARFAAAQSNLGVEIRYEDLAGSLGHAPLSVPLRAGDTIVVPEAGMVQVDGEVNRPGSFQLASRMTLLGAIASASGLTYSADVTEVEVIRELGSGKKALLTVDLEKVALRDGKDIRLRDGDIVRVPSHSGRFATRQVVTSINSLFSFGMSSNVGP